MGRAAAHLAVHQAGDQVFVIGQFGHHHATLDLFQTEAWHRPEAQLPAGRGELPYGVVPTITPPRPAPT